MSRIGKLPIQIPDGVSLKLEGQQLSVTGPKGSLSLEIPSRATLAVAGKQASVTVKNPNHQTDRALWGLTRVLVSNMVIGVTNGFSKQLEINGVGYRATITGQDLMLNVGYSHPVAFKIPEGIEIKVEKNLVTVSGIDKQQVGETAAKIRSVRKPEPYKGKGIKYAHEVIRRKAGKVMKAAGAAGAK